MLFLVTAAANADVLYLKNGDRITGEIKRIWDDEVTIEPEYSDEFAVDLPLVERIESDREFEIEMPDGTEIVGRMQGIDDEGNQVIEIDGDSVSVALSALREVDEPEDFYDWELLVDYSLTVNNGNTDSLNSRLSGEGMFKHGDHRHIGKVTQTLEEQDSATTKDHSLLSYTYNWLFSDPWFFAANGQVERDPIRDLTRRLTASAGIGRDIWNDPHRFLNVAFDWDHESQPAGTAEKTDTTFSIGAGLEFD